MKYLKFEYLILVSIFIYILLQWQILPRVKIETDKENIAISSKTIQIPLTITSYKNGVYKLTSYFAENKNRTPTFKNLTILLRKGQKYSFKYIVDNPSLDKKSSTLILMITDNIRNKIVFSKKYKIEKSIYEPKTISVAITTTTIPNNQQPIKFIETTKTEIQTSTKTIPDKLIPPPPEKEKYNFEISISSEYLKTEYFYNEKISVIYYLKNNSKYYDILLDVTANLKNNSDVNISSKTEKIKLLIGETEKKQFDFDITQNIFPDIYYVNLIFNTNNKQIETSTAKFSIVDTPPKITLHEIPTIKQKLNNTIMAEIEDDRGIEEVKLIEITNNNKEKKEYSMALIAGNKTLGLYSFTTQKITKKGVYIFYIQATDISKNLTKTKEFNIPITK